MNNAYSTALVLKQTPLAIIAGGGALPRVLALSTIKAGQPVFVVALKGSVESNWYAEHPHLEARPEQVGKILQAMRKAGCADVVMIGRVRRPTISELRPDLTGVWWVFKLWVALRNLGDDGLLRAIRTRLEKVGLNLKSIQDFVGEVLAPEGQLGQVAVSADALQDVRKAYTLSQMIGKLDIGQAAVVQQGLVLGLEAIEGTDALIKRCAELKRLGRGPVLVKTAKPQQDRALDLPALGVETLRLAAEGGYVGIAYSAGSVLMADLPSMVERADAAGLFLFGVKDSDLL
jgi:UDP-2,3-diacylglucosamine hydrolase